MRICLPAAFICIITISLTIFQSDISSKGISASRIPHHRYLHIIYVAALTISNAIGIQSSFPFQVANYWFLNNTLVNSLFLFINICSCLGIAASVIVDLCTDLAMGHISQISFSLYSGERIKILIFTILLPISCLSYPLVSNWVSLYTSLFDISSIICLITIYGAGEMQKC